MKHLVTTNEYNKEYNIDEIDNLKKYIIDMVKTFTKFEHIEIFQIIYQLIFLKK